ncbi:MAG: MoxR family ATPase [Candidatus Woesearchaeota archaeon]
MKDYKGIFDTIFQQMGGTVIGQHDVIEQILAGMLCDGNALLEGYPGLAKTMIVRNLAGLMDLKFSRIQNTPDLMPSDVTGTYIIEEHSGRREFKFQQGPIFSNIVLADEINRATPKTQSALLEAMQEKQVTVGNSTFKLDLPFFVLATQNPIEQEGTYPLPEAQADRFIFKIKTEYPSYEDEVKIVHKYASEETEQSQKPMLEKKNLLSLQKITRQIPIANDLRNKAVKIVVSTRNMKDLLEYGASPRASIGLILASKARALMHGRNHVSSEDIETMAYPILRHRIILNFEAERKGMDADAVIKEAISKAK